MTIARLLVAIDARGAVKGALQYRNAVRSMTTANASAQAGMNGLKMAALKLFAVMGGAIVFKKATSLLMDYQDVMAQIEGVTNATEAQMRQFNATARELGATTRFTATQAGEGLLELSRAGFTVADSQKAIAATLDLATAAVMDLGEASGLTSTTIKQFGLDAGDARRVVDVLITSANSAKTTVPELGQALGYVGAVANSAGVSLEETAAIIAVLQDRGIEGTRAGAGLRTTILKLINPTKKAQEQIKALGLTLDEVNPMKVGLTQAFKNLSGAQMDLSHAGKILDTRQAALGLIMAQNTDAIEAQIQKNKDNEMVSRRLAALLENTLGGAWKELISTMQEVILQIGEAGFAGAVEDAIRFTIALVRELAGIQQKASAVTPAVAGMAEALRQVVTVTKILIALSLPLLFGVMAVKVKAAAIAFWGLAKAIVATNVALLRMAGSLLSVLFPAILAIGKAIMTVMIPAVLAFAAVYGGLKFGQWISQFAPVQRFMQKTIEGFVKGWEFFKKTMRTIWATTKSLFITIFIHPIQVAFRTFMDLLYKGINAIAKKAKDALLGVPMMEEAYKSLAKVVEATSGGYKMDLVRDTVVEDAKIIEDEYQKALKSIEDNTAAVFEKIARGVDKPKKSIKDLIQEDMKAVIEAMGLFGENSAEADEKMKRLVNHVALLRENMAENNSKSKDMLSIWTRAKNKVVEFGMTAVNWFRKIGEEQDKTKDKSEKMKVTLEDIGGAASSTLVDLAMGATTFKEALADVTDQIIRMALQMAIMSAFSTPGVGGNPVPKAGKGLVAMANGGIVKGPTPALIGEAGPEAVIPLTRNEKGEFGLAGGETVNNTTFNLVSPDARGIKDMLLNDPKLVRQMNQTYEQGYAIS